MMISIGAFAWGYWQVGFESLARWVVAFGIFWIVAQWQKWRWVSSVWTVSAVLLAIFGLWFDLNLGWMFSGALFALFAWDLTEFRRKLKQLSPREDAKGMERRHVLRLGFLSAGGILIALLLDRLW
ncbi:MAG: hypothetical protein QY328_08410 [Anaerolineales bacterium]|nr:MAG: hypothetical protein QY328_08410 [Anaerolineales bacterium]